jgi:LPS export ABC transporter permease LptG/LPS export ABC transporter permease LptF
MSGLRAPDKTNKVKLSNPATKVSRGESCMRFGSRLIERYIVRAVMPYMLLALLLQGAILFAQESSRFAELLMEVRVPLWLATEFTLALIPRLLVYTLPIAMLIGTLTGFSRMGSDSELVGMRAAGVGPWKMLWPVLLLGSILTGATFYLNLVTAPEAESTLRRVALRAALYRLDSPVDPRSFNADIPGYLIYVRDGDKTQGQWGRVFIYSQDKSGATRVVTARSGRIDSAAEQSELVLNDAVLITLPSTPSQGGGGEYVTERVAQTRIVLETGRKALVERLRRDEPEPDEMGVHELSDVAASAPGVEGRRAKVVLHKRLMQSSLPLVLALLGAALGLRIKRGGRGMGLVLSLLIFIAYSLVRMAGEQMARAGTLPPVVGMWLATALMIGVALALIITSDRNILGWLARGKRTETVNSTLASPVSNRRMAKSGSTRLLSFPSLLDMSMLRALSLSLLFAFAALAAIFLIFTLLESWRAVAETGVALGLLGQYVLFLLPFMTVQILPTSVLLAELATYALIARRSEAIAWWASGQSVYRLVLPGLLFAMSLGVGVWLVQEQLMPQANIRQDALRSQMRGGAPRATTPLGRQWLAAPGGRLYAYEFDDKTETLSQPAVYEFDAEETHLRRIVMGEKGVWTSPGKMLIEGAEVVDLKETKIERDERGRAEITGVDPPSMFKSMIDKPSQLSADRLRDYIKTLKSRGGVDPSLTVALQRKYAEPFSVLVMALTGIPLAFTFGRRSALAALCSAIIIAFAFWIMTGRFQQLGDYGLLPPPVAAWAPLVIFAAAGTYLLSRART